jgi:hypothetical protein
MLHVLRVPSTPGIPTCGKENRRESPLVQSSLFLFFFLLPRRVLLADRRVHHDPIEGSSRLVVKRWPRNISALQYEQPIKTAIAGIAGTGDRPETLAGFRPPPLAQTRRHRTTTLAPSQRPWNRLPTTATSRYDWSTLVWCFTRCPSTWEHRLKPPGLNPPAIWMATSRPQAHSSAFPL